jgi:hypothetical protein
LIFDQRSTPNREYNKIQDKFDICKQYPIVQNNRIQAKKKKENNAANKQLKKPKF